MAAARRILLAKKSVSAGKPLFDPVWNYDRRIGEIFVHEYGGYDGGITGQIEVREPSGTSPAGDLNGGYYDNR